MRSYVLAALLCITFSLPALCVLAGPGAPYFNGDNGMGPLVVPPTIPLVIESTLVDPDPSEPGKDAEPMDLEDGPIGEPVAFRLLLLETPEPGTWVMFAVGGALVLASRRR